MPLVEQDTSAKRSGTAFSMKSELFQRPVTADDRMFFTEQLALLLETGSALHKSLQLLHNQMENPRVRDIIADLALQVEKGRAFSYALLQHPEMFPTTYVKLVEASEGGGFMAKVLDELLAMDEKQQQLKGTVSSAMTYPMFLLVFSGAVVIFVMVFVFPKFAEIFSSIKDQLPASTIVLMAISDLLRIYWLAVSAVVGGIVAGSVFWAKSAAGGATLDRLKLRTPMLRNIFQKIYLVQLMRVLSLSLGNGVSVRDALSASRDVVNNRAYRALIRETEKSVQEGGRISDVFCQSAYVPELARQMLATGDETGTLSKVMARIADYYSRELTKQLNQLSKLAEPVMLVVMGLVVGIIVSSLILPIFKLSSVAM